MTCQIQVNCTRRHKKIYIVVCKKRKEINRDLSIQMLHSMQCILLDLMPSIGLYIIHITVYALYIFPKHNESLINYELVFASARARARIVLLSYTNILSAIVHMNNAQIFKRINRKLATIFQTHLYRWHAITQTKYQ